MVTHVITLYLNKIEWWNMKKLHTMRSTKRHIQQWYTTEQLSSRTNVVVRTVHTDVVVIALGYFHQLEDKRIWVESGIQSKNNLRYISIKQLFDQLGELLYKALSFYHAFTGCDYTSSFNRKGISRNIFESVTLWRYTWWHQINHRVFCVSNVWKKDNKLSRSSKSRDLYCQVKPEKRICFSQPKSSKEVGFKHNATMFQSPTSKDQALYLCCKYLDELT